MKTRALFVLIPLAAVLSACALAPLSTGEVNRWDVVANPTLEDYKAEAVCSLHHVPTVETVVPAYGGLSVLPPKRYVRARIHDFPNSWLYVNTGFCEQGEALPVIRWYCPVCRKAEMRWLRLHRYLLPPEISPTTGEWTGPSTREPAVSERRDP